MKKFLLYILLFAAIIVIADVAFGFICSFLNKHARGGDTALHYNVTEVQQAPVLILGSSRATHHYDPAIMEDSLGCGVYNCGLDGNGILFQYGRLSMILDRYTPEIVIYDAIPSFDMAPDDNTKYLSWLRRWYGVHDIDSLMYEISPAERFKLHSALYRYNGAFIQMLSDYIHPVQKSTYNGYRPLDGIMDYEPVDHQNKATEWQPIKLKYFTKFIDLCKARNIMLVVVYSPFYGTKSSIALKRLTELCAEKGIMVIDCYSDSLFMANPRYFEDAAHLNHTGASVFSKMIAAEINKIKQNDKEK